MRLKKSVRPGYMKGYSRTCYDYPDADRILRMEEYCVLCASVILSNSSVCPGGETIMVKRMEKEIHKLHEP